MEADRLSGKSCPFCGSENIGRRYEFADPLQCWEYCKDCKGSIRCIIVVECGTIYEIDFSKVWEVSDELRGDPFEELIKKGELRIK